MPQFPRSIRPASYGWIIVVLAAMAMVATLPGRTHGLGMITERLLEDPSLDLNRTSFGYVNFWATLIGALFCFPAGWMLDRWGIRMTSSLVVAMLGIVVLAMTHAAGMVQFAILITLTRGLGQSALSVASISMTGKWFREQLPLATGVYSVLVSVGFAAAFIWGRGQSGVEWRVQWQMLGVVLLFVFTPIFALLVRSGPRDDSTGGLSRELSKVGDFTFSEALGTPAFWAFGFATSLYGLVASGTSLFNESLLVERGFDKSAFYDLGLMTTGIGLFSNLVTGWLATQVGITTLTAVAMSLLATALLGLPFVGTYPQLVVYAMTMGITGGIVTVLFFTVWARLFGSSQLGRIQSVAQMLTVVASALGPVILAEMKERTGSYVSAIVFLGVLAAFLAGSICLVPIPKRAAIMAPGLTLEPAAST